MPSAGKRVVLRLLDKNQARLTLERLGTSLELTLRSCAMAVTQTARHFSGDGADRFRQLSHAGLPGS